MFVNFFLKCNKVIIITINYLTRTREDLTVIIVMILKKKKKSSLPNRINEYIIIKGEVFPIPYNMFAY